jgi:hypothetical protein
MSKLLIVMKEVQVLRVIVAICAITVTTTCHAQALANSASNEYAAGGVITLPESGSSSLPDAPTAQAALLLSPRSNGTASHGLSSQVHAFPTFGERKKNYIYDLVGPGAFIGAAVQSAIDETHPLKVGYPPDGIAGIGKHPAHGSVPEWGEGGEGFSKRYASRFGMGLIGTPLAMDSVSSCIKMFPISDALAPALHPGHTTLLRNRLSPIPQAVEEFPRCRRLSRPSSLPKSRPSPGIRADTT